MTIITENIIETFEIELLDKLGYEYIYTPDIAYDGNVSANSADKRENYAKV